MKLAKKKLLQFFLKWIKELKKECKNGTWNRLELLTVAIHRLIWSGEKGTESYSMKGVMISSAEIKHVSHAYVFVVVISGVRSIRFLCSCFYISFQWLIFREHLSSTTPFENQQVCPVFIFVFSAAKKNHQVLKNSSPITI